MSTINKYIERLITEGGTQNFLIINLKDGVYIQFAAEKGKQEIYCEVSGNNPKTNVYLNEVQINQLLQLNWSLSDSQYHNNYSQIAFVKNATDLIKLVQLIHTTTAIFKTSESAYSYQLNLQ